MLHTSYQLMSISSIVENTKLIWEVHNMFFFLWHCGDRKHSSLNSVLQLCNFKHTLLHPASLNRWTNLLLLEDPWADYVVPEEKTSSHILSKAKNRMKGTVLCTALQEGLGGKVHTGLSRSELRSPCSCWVHSGGAVIEVRRGYISILEKHSWGWTVLELQWLSKRTVIRWKCQRRKGCSLWNLSFLSFSARGSLTERLPHACRFSPRILAAAEECYKLPTPPPHENAVTLHYEKLSCHWLLGKWRPPVIYLPTWASEQCVYKSNILLAYTWATVIHRLFLYNCWHKTHSHTLKRSQHKITRDVLMQISDCMIKKCYHDRFIQTY